MSNEKKEDLAVRVDNTSRQAMVNVGVMAAAVLVGGYAVIKINDLVRKKNENP